MSNHPGMKCDSKARRFPFRGLWLLPVIGAFSLAGCRDEPGCSATWRMSPGETREDDVEVRVGTVSLDSCLADVTGTDEGIADADVEGAETAGTSRCRLDVSVTVSEDAAPGEREIDFEVRYEYHDTATDEILEESDPAKLCIVVL